jgi:plastocyanin
MSRTKVLIVALLTAAGLSLATQVPVNIIEYAFQPDTVRISPGDSVIWTNNGALLHTSTSGVSPVWDSLWDSGDLAHGASFVHGFPADGTFQYFCRYHYLNGMKGVVVVGTGSGASESPYGAGVGLKLAAFPNPFRSSTTINYLLPQPGPAAISVVDAAGRVVRALRAPSGASSLSWDGRDDAGRALSPGVYFVRLSTASGTMNAKVLQQR